MARLQPTDEVERGTIGQAAAVPHERHAVGETRQRAGRAWRSNLMQRGGHDALFTITAARVRLAMLATARYGR